MAANSRFQPLGILRFDLFFAVEQSLHAALVFLGFVRIKRVFDSAQRHVQRHAPLFPTLHQRPIDRAEPEMLASAANEGVFDFGEITEVIQSSFQVSSSTRFANRNLKRETLNLKLISFV